jgi:hypothetical protein
MITGPIVGKDTLGTIKGFPTNRFSPTGTTGNRTGIGKSKMAGAFREGIHANPIAKANRRVRITSPMAVSTKCRMRCNHPEADSRAKWLTLPAYNRVGAGSSREANPNPTARIGDMKSTGGNKAVAEYAG